MGLELSAPLMMAGLGARGTREVLINRAFLQCLVKSLCTLGHREREDGILRRAAGEHRVGAAETGLGKEVVCRRAIIVAVGVVGVGVSSVVCLRRSDLDGEHFEMGGYIRARDNVSCKFLMDLTRLVHSFEFLPFAEGV
jgi:hypothetical protein